MSSTTNGPGQQTSTLNIALVGYGKMGKAIEEIALQRGHNIFLRIDIHSVAEFTKENLEKCDVAIEFTGPHSAADNILKCLKAGIPVVSGSTGWLDKWDDIKNACDAFNGSLVYASNYSVGVNIFFELNKLLSRLMDEHSAYDVSLEEIHHTEKKDAPSGTAITLAEQILDNLKRKEQWVNDAASVPAGLSIISSRVDPAPGTHKVKYSSLIDDIEIIHTAHSRKGFATGAVLAAEFVKGKRGIFSMKDVLGF